jgi:uncharacterized protein (DUF885 family)
MLRARSYLIEHDIVSVPSDERIEIVPTPEYLRNVMPFAAYFEPPKFDPNPSGIYIVTPSVGNDPNAMREHSYSSISNTSLHEAYPGHHLQLSVASKHPSLTRLLIDAPEFVEGWGMYSEQMMREQGFDDAPNFRLNMYTDAIWRACRIILDAPEFVEGWAMYCELMMREQGFDTAPSHRLMMHTDAIWRACRIIIDVKLQRGLLTVEQATDFLVEQTGFERPQAAAEVNWYTYRPTYPMSYLLGRQLLRRLRVDEQKRLGASFSLKNFHDALLVQGSLPISFQRRLLASGV